MPPKAIRGRVAARGGRGGRGRGGVSSASAGDAHADTAPTPPEQGVDNTVGGASASVVQASIDANVSSQPAATASSASTLAEAPARPPVQRLDSLKTPSAASSRSGSPATLGSARGKRTAAPAIIKPSYTGRRSKQERDEIESVRKKRELERKIAIAAEAEKTTKREKDKSKRGAYNRTRGGHQGAVSGIFSAGPSASQIRASGLLLSGSRATRVKEEPGDGHSMEASEDGGTSQKNIDTTLLSSDDEETPLDSAKKNRDLVGMLMPVRIHRKDHRDRVVGINTGEASAASDPASQQPDDSEGLPAAQGAAAGSRQDRPETDDVEITDVHKTSKDEPLGDDEVLGNAPALGQSAGDSSKTATDKSSPPSPETDKKARDRSRPAPTPAAPAFQTQEERDEWARFEASRQYMIKELGSGFVADAASPAVEGVDDGTKKEDQLPKAAAVEEAGDGANGVDEAAKAEPQTERDNNVYLFQLPPIMPDLLAPKVKKEASDEAETVGNTEETPIAMDEGAQKPSNKLKCAAGHVGKLRVHKSGRTTLDWGGVSFEVKPGLPADSLQEVVCVDINSEKERTSERDGGDALSFGRVKGKFVVTPGWGDILGMSQEEIKFG